MSGSAKTSGVAELRQQLQAAASEIREEARGIVVEETEGAAADVRQAYEPHRRSGRMIARVRTRYPSSGSLLGQMQSAAPHSNFLERGTQSRRTRTGANRGAVPAPAAALVAAIAVMRRDRMFRRLTDLLRRHGFQVSGA